MSDVNELSVEELVEQINSNTGHSLQNEVHSPSSVNEQKAQTTSLSCSLGEVKDAVHSKPVSAPVPSTSFDGFNIDNPVRLLFLLDENIRKGIIKLHPWQIQFMLDFADTRHTKESPFQACAQTCNSSGKDKYIIAACSVWLCMRHKDTYCPITSSSGDQLDKQTSIHIDRLCHAANALFGDIWKINYRYYECKHMDELGIPRPSMITLFATDEAGKAEGYHPVDVGKKMAIFTGETKSIPLDITDALERWHGFTHRIDVSSPGLPVGYFYDTCMSAIPRKDVKDIKDLDSTQFLLYKITVYECPHITESEIKRTISKFQGGVNHPIVKSSLFAEFGTTDEMVVIPSSFVWSAVKNPPEYHPEPYNTGGLDLSDGGAETVLIVRNGNKVLAIIPFKFQDTEDTIDFLEQKFKEWKLDNKNALVYADCCGLGKPMINSLRRKGWSNMRYVDSRNSASEYRVYKNRGTELFFHVRELLQNHELIVPYDKELVSQLSTRYYKITVDNIHQLLSKLEQRSRGFPSPDRADAFNLAFWSYKSTRVEGDIKPPFEDEKEETQEPPLEFDFKKWAEQGNIRKYTIEAQYVDESDHEDLQQEVARHNQLIKNYA